MKILRFPSYYEPETVSSSHLTADLERAYAAEGFEVELYAPTPTRGVSDEVRKKYKKIPYEEKLDGHIRVHRFGMGREKKNPILRAIRYIRVVLKQYRRGKRARDVDIVMGSSTPPILGIACAKVAKKLSKKYRRHVPFVYVLQDVFPDSLSTTGLARHGSLIYRIGTRIANYIYKNADIIIAISEDIKKNIMEKGVPEEKIRVIHNWINVDEVGHVEKGENRLCEELGLDPDKFRVVYAGNLGMAQGAEVLLDAAERLREHTDTEIVIFGTGARAEAIKARAEGLPNVRLFPLMPPERVSEVYSLGDACAVTCKRGTVGAGVPSKTWSIMACATPLLVAFDEGSELTDTVERAGAGLCSPAEDGEALAVNILKLKNSSEEREKMGKAAREYAERFCSSGVATAKYIDVLREAAANSR